MQSSKPAGRTVKKRLADGTIREYHYAPHKSPRFAHDTVGALILAYKRSPEWLRLADNTRQMYGIYLRVLEADPHTRVADVTRRAVLELRDAVASMRGPGASTGFLRAASALFGWALDREWIQHSPMHRVKPIPGGTLPAWSEEQALHAIGKLAEHFRRVVVLAWHTGQRRGDLVRLRWSDYDGSVIRLVQGKTGAAMVIPTTPELRAELDAWKRGATSLTILADRRGKPWDATYLSSSMGRALAKIDLPGLNVHGLRKLRAAGLADAGATTHEIAAVTGHRTLAMIAHYTRSADQERLAVTAMGKAKK